MLNPVLQNPWVRAGAFVGALVVVGMLISLLSSVLVPLFFAFIVAYIFAPVINHFEKKRVPRTVAVVGLVLFILFLLISIPLFVLPSMIREAERMINVASHDLPDQWADKMLNKLPLEEWMMQLGWVPEEQMKISAKMNVSLNKDGMELETPASETSANVEGERGIIKQSSQPEILVNDPATSKVELRQSTKPGFNARAELAERIGLIVKEDAVEFLRVHAQEFLGVGKFAGTSAKEIVSSVANIIVAGVLLLGNFVLFAFVTTYLLKDYDRIVMTIHNLVPPRYRYRVNHLMHSIDLQLRSYLRGQFLVCCCLGTMYCTGFLIADVPFAVPLALFGGMASFVPYLGFALISLPVVLLTLLQHGFDWHVLAAMATFGIAQPLEAYFITPRIMGHQVGLSPVWVILSIMVFSSTLGFVGLLLAVPIAAVLKVLVGEAVRMYKSSRVFEGPTSPMVL